MNIQVAAKSPAVAGSSSEPSQTSGERWCVIARFLVASTASAAVCLLVWSAAPQSLSGPIHIIGGPTYFGYDYRPPFWAYRLVVVAFPLLLISFYAALARFGPLRRRTGGDTRQIRLVTESETSHEPKSPFANLLGILARLALPTALLTVMAGTRTGDLDKVAGLWGLLYLGAVLVSAIALRRFGTSRRKITGHWLQLLEAVSLANGVGGAMAALLGLWVVSRHTVVFSTAGLGRSWPWLPLWLAVLGMLAILLWALQQLGSQRTARSIEKRLLVGIVGSVSIFFATSWVPGVTGYFYGFDDAQEITGAGLLNRGYFPWRDQLFIHGLFPDVLSGNIGIAIFGDSIWGVFAGNTVLLTPLCWVFLYLFAAWVSKGNPWCLAIVVMGAASGFFPSQLRFILVPLALLVLGETVKRQSRGWCAGLVILLFVQAILAPETMFLALPALACVAAADIVHRTPGVSIWRSLQRTRWCAITGCIAVLSFAALLAWQGALKAHLDYYVIFGSGHNVAGALPLNQVPPAYVYRWLVGIGLVLATVWAAAARIRRRQDWLPQDWVALAAAGFLLIYQEKALGRFDPPHIDQVFTIALPLLLLWLWKGVSTVEAAVVRRNPRWTVRPTAILCLAFGLWFSDQLLPAARNLDNRHRLVAEADSHSPRLDYAAPNAVPRQLIRDLDYVLRTFAGDDQPVFDFTNSPGYVYYLLNRDPGTRFTHVSMAIPPYAQQILIDELKRSRPPVVIYDSTYIGLPSWDYVSNSVRHYRVSQYLLDEWVPVLRTHGNLIMVRRDLIQSGVPALPHLTEAPTTTDLWFGRRCDWGVSPNYLPTSPHGASTTLPIRVAEKRKFVEISGWATEPITGEPATAVYLVADGTVIGSVTPSLERPDVAQVLGLEYSASGFWLAGTLSTNSSISVYLMGKNDILHPLAGTPTQVASIRLPDGRVLPTSSVVVGNIEYLQATTATVGQIEIPEGARLADYDLASLSADGQSFGARNVIITDHIGDARHHITARSLPSSNSHFAIRVGSCPQWQGFDPTGPVYVLYGDGPPVTSVTLSGVRDD